ncbi:MAG TPA: argininosuccinate lyase, partial [Caldithrix abyssi]|nr:argininosuccinate lyase [Caldithrix abyssi]
MADKKLWQSAETPLNTLIEAYTVGDDYLTDGELLPFDLRASEAHGAMLHKQGVLSDDEWRALQKGLREIGELWEQGRFSIRPEQEDGHTAIEQFLTEKYGEAGKKIHTGRSRNDQALVMLRL